MAQSRDTTFQVNDTSVKGYFASPQNPKAGVIVLHAWWGLTPFFKQFCDRLANEGFAVFAPDLRNGETASTVAEAEALMKREDSDLIQSIVEASIDQFRANANLAGQKLGVVGFSMGAAWAIVLSALKPNNIGAVVLFYGAYPGFEHINQAKAAFQGHFAEHDPYEPVEGIQAMESDLKSAGLSTDFHFYPNSGHWFFEDNRPDAYSQEAAHLAWQRTIEFLHNKL